jgi:hypothetical protein
MSVTTWNNAPDYDQWGNDTQWDCNDWILYHKLLKAKFGQNIQFEIGIILFHLQNLSTMLFDQNLAIKLTQQQNFRPDNLQFYS